VDGLAFLRGRASLFIGTMPWLLVPILCAGYRAAMPPTMANGKICHIEIPAIDVKRSAEFYENVFGWKIRRRGNGSIAFDDSVGEVSGTWVTGRPPAGAPGFMIYVMVDSVEATIEAVKAEGGEIVQPIGADAPEITARFKDPAGNVIGLYQQPAER
jgi:predicted enzyme related to lactoylglutathione lyase